MDITFAKRLSRLQRWMMAGDFWSSVMTLIGTPSVLWNIIHYSKISFRTSLPEICRVSFVVSNSGYLKLKKGAINYKE